MQTLSLLRRRGRLALSGAMLTACLGLLSMPLGAQAQLQPGYAIKTTEHVDIGVGYSAAEGFDLHVHQDIPSIEYAANEVLLYAASQARTVQPAGAQWSFIGAGAGNPVWILPQNQNPALLFLGIAGEEIPAGTFSSAVTLSLTGLTGPGQFSIWQTDTFGNPTAFMSSADGISAADSLPVPIGSHAHYNYGFTQAGFYEVTLQATGTLTSGGTITSDPTTYYFGVETTSPSAVAPEPGTLALAATGLLGFTGMVVKRRRSAA